MKRTALLFFVSTLAAIANAQAPRGTDFVRIDGGSFTMGSPASELNREKDEVQRRVTVSDFYMARFELTQKEFRGLMNTDPSYFKGDDLPVENVSWFDAVRYCNARSRKEGLTPAYVISGESVSWNRNANGYRLPTEAEWEYACRAGTTTPFSTEDFVSTRDANYYGTYPYTIEQHYFSQTRLQTPPGEYRQRTVPVGSLPPNPWGLYEMHGNVGEWCWDWYGDYDSTARNDPAGPATGRFRVSRGGAWNDFGRHLRSAHRTASMPNTKLANLGFRLVRSVR